MLKIVAKTDDSHGIFKTINTINFFSQSFFPAELKIIDEKAIISSIPNDSLAKVNDLKVSLYLNLVR
ncbi:hypothetical protein [Flavobacterium sp. HJJ]|uniref:hypothetical protein n=1 Tax=Flavobacterium sp. HJJ TaxID=2783792 RepID=UPI00188B2EFF|nr:hypothetical protein [Flavobacterium sp. HJJ]MBF4472118.1 hypothetical protein [Flavobacterium sp. HJJ]